MGIGERIFLANLIAFLVQGFDVILGMDWLAMHYASIDCAWKEVTFKLPKGETITFVGLQVWSLPPILSAVQPRKLALGGGLVFLAFIVESS